MAGWRLGTPALRSKSPKILRGRVNWTCLPGRVPESVQLSTVSLCFLSKAALLRSILEIRFLSESLNCFCVAGKKRYVCVAGYEKSSPDSLRGATLPTHFAVRNREESNQKGRRPRAAGRESEVTCP